MMLFSGVTAHFKESWGFELATLEFWGPDKHEYNSDLLIFHDETTNLCLL